jgi:hypothetical protein
MTDESTDIGEATKEYIAAWHASAAVDPHPTTYDVSYARKPVVAATATRLRETFRANKDSPSFIWALFMHAACKGTPGVFTDIGIELPETDIDGTSLRDAYVPRLRYKIMNLKLPARLAVRKAFADILG